MYPSIILENNIAPNTQYGRIIIEDPDNPDRRYSKNEHQDMYTNSDEEAKYSRGGEFLENLMSSNILEFGWRWMNLGDVFDVESDLREFYEFNTYNGPSIDSNFMDAIYFTKDKTTPVFIENIYGPQPVFISDDPLDNSISDDLIEEIKKGALL